MNYIVHFMPVLHLAQHAWNLSIINNRWWATQSLIADREMD